MEANNSPVNFVEKHKDNRKVRLLLTKISIGYAPAAAAASKTETGIVYYRFGTLENISDTGVCLTANDTFTMPMILNLYLKISDETSGIKMLGKVIWTRKEEHGLSRVGVKFVGTLPPNWVKLIVDAKIA